MQRDWYITQESALGDIANKVATLCPEQCFLALHGNLGSGKTTFAKHLGHVWGIEDVKSPSFDIVHIHQGMRRLIHIDAFRLDEKAVFDWDDLCHAPFCVLIEWPERLVLPFTFQLQVYFSIQSGKVRHIYLETV